MTKLIPSAMIALGLAASLAPPALAEGAGPQVSLASLLDGGYEVKSALALSDADQKSIWPDEPVGPFTLILLQKGASLAVCTYPTSSLTSMDSSAVADKIMCHKR